MTATEKKIFKMVKDAEMLELEEIMILVNDTFKLHFGYRPSLCLEDDSNNEEKENGKRFWQLYEAETEWDGRAEKIKDCYLGFYEWLLLEEIYKEKIYQEEQEQEMLYKMTPRQRAEWLQW